MWLKYRHLNVDGPGGWVWKDIGEDYKIRNVVDLIQAKAFGSSFYRGIEYEVHAFPPAHVLEKHIEKADAKAKAYENRALALRSQLARVKPTFETITLYGPDEWHCCACEKDIVADVGPRSHLTCPHCKSEDVFRKADGCWPCRICRGGRREFQTAYGPFGFVCDDHDGFGSR